MAKKMLIVHGYSDGSTSFTALRDFFVAQGAYAKKDVYLLDYSSMDDEATFHDFADKLDTEYESLFGGERIDIACHSTGSLVTRAWLALRYERRRRRGLDRTCPVHRLLMFAPANFGSDLASMGQSFLGKFRTTFFNSHSHKAEDFMESGKTVLQGLEPASPFQWQLSCMDLHPYDFIGSYFDRRSSTKESERCYPFVIAAAEGYTGLQAKIIKKRNKPGTDGTVRISGTSMNTAYCTLDFRTKKTIVTWNKDIKYEQVPFSVFAGFNHGSIIDPKKKAFLGQQGPGTLALKALDVKNLADYKAAAEDFNKANEVNYSALKGGKAHRYQQFFFKVRDDVDIKVDDYFIDFYVLGSDGKTHRTLTETFDRDFAAEFYRHSDDPACRVMMVNCRKLPEFTKKLVAAKARLVFDVTAKAPLPNVTYQMGSYVVFDGASAKSHSGPSFIRPNTTLLVDIVLNREADSKVLNVKDQDLKPAVRQTGRALPEASGRAELLHPAGKK